MQYYHEAQQLARAHVPSQKFGEIYSPKCALVYGTAFPELYQPYEECEHAGYGYRNVRE